MIAIAVLAGVHYMLHLAVYSLGSWVCNSMNRAITRGNNAPLNLATVGDTWRYTSAGALLLLLLLLDLSRDQQSLLYLGHMFCWLLVHPALMYVYLKTITTISFPACKQNNLQNQVLRWSELITCLISLLVNTLTHYTGMWLIRWWKIHWYQWAAVQSWLPNV